jgi:hypothetical protein
MVGVLHPLKYAGVGKNKKDIKVDLARLPPLYSPQMTPTPAITTRSFEI